MTDNNWDFGVWGCVGTVWQQQTTPKSKLIRVGYMNPQTSVTISPHLKSNSCQHHSKKEIKVKISYIYKWIIIKVKIILGKQYVQNQHTNFVCVSLLILPVLNSDKGGGVATCWQQMQNLLTHDDSSYIDWK